MSDNQNNNKSLIDLFIDSFQKRPIFTTLFVLFIAYIIWYFMGGPERVEKKYDMSGWALIFKHLFRF